MLFDWLAERRRRHILARPFPAEWEACLVNNVAIYRELDDGERRRLRELVQVFVAEKRWEGCGGLELTDEIRVTIAAEACVLLLGRDHSLFNDVESILVYPSTVVRPVRPRGFFSPAAEVEPGQVPLLGEAHHGGPVLLVWDAVRRAARDADDGRNVVFHEFAHKIDMLDGDADGTPPLAGAARARAWVAACEPAFLALKAELARGRKSFLDAYAATNEAEFFAVATEAFFETPREMQAALPQLYAVLTDFYKQDPAARRHRARGEAP